jgi:hypothetical protein
MVDALELVLFDSAVMSVAMFAGIILALAYNGLDTIITGHFATVVFVYAVSIASIRRLAESTFPILDVVLTFIGNVVRYPFLAARLNKYFNKLPSDAQNGIVRIVRVEMDNDAVAQVLNLIDDYVCDICGKLQIDCVCSEASDDSRAVRPVG